MGNVTSPFRFRQYECGRHTDARVQFVLNPAAAMIYGWMLRLA